MLHIHNPYGRLDSDEVLRAVAEQCAPPVRDLIESWHDTAEGAEEREAEAREEGYYAAREEGCTEAHEELEGYREGWDAVFEAWQDTIASGHWPCAEATDGDLHAAIRDDMQKGADAIEALRAMRAEVDADGPERKPRAILAALLAILRDAEAVK